MRIVPEQQIQHWVNRLGFVLRKELQAGFRQQDLRISAEEWAVLLLLWQEDRQTPGALALKTVKDQTTLTRLIDGMVRKGLVLRQPDEQDRRRLRVVLTALGNAMQEKLLPIAGKVIAQSEQGISVQDLETTRRVLRQMSENMLKGKPDGKL